MKLENGEKKLEADSSSFDAQYQENRLSDKILNNFLAISSIGLSRENYLEFCRTTGFLDIEHQIYWLFQSVKKKCKKGPKISGSHYWAADRLKKGGRNRSVAFS